MLAYYLRRNLETSDSLKWKKWHQYGLWIKIVDWNCAVEGKFGGNLSWIVASRYHARASCKWSNYSNYALRKFAYKSLGSLKQLCSIYKALQASAVIISCPHCSIGWRLCLIHFSLQYCFCGLLHLLLLRRKLTNFITLV